MADNAKEIMVNEKEASTSQGRRQMKKSKYTKEGTGSKINVEDYHAKAKINKERKEAKRRLEEQNRLLKRQLESQGY